MNNGASYDLNNALKSTDGAAFEYLNDNLVKKTAGSHVTDYDYNTSDRLVSVTEDGNLKAEYGYDPFGRRLWKEVDGVRIYFLYSDEGLVGEFDESGTEVKAYGYAPDSFWGTSPLFLRSGGSYFWG